MNPLLPHKKRKRTSYHTDVKIAVQLSILPEKIKRQIPKSTLSAFRNSDYSDIFGIEYSDDVKAGVELARKLVKNAAVIKIYKAYNRIKNTIISIVSTVKGMKSHLKQFKEKIVSTIVRIKDAIGLNRACKYFKISVSRFYSWLHQIQHQCPASALKKCRRKWPNQLTAKELNAMKRCLDDSFYRGWAIYQIAVHALLNNTITACAGTWYKYIHELGISINKIKKQNRKTGIRTDRPNGIWHMDVTVYKVFDNVKAYIYILIDNFSRYILNWRVSLELSGKTCLSLLRESYGKYIEHRVYPEETTILLCDGGPENNNGDVDGFVNQEFIPIRKLVAQKDIHFSNSMIEAFNKTLKYRHLFPNNISTFEGLGDHLEKCIPEYNGVRPHCAHKYLTPAQVYFGNSIDLVKIKKQLIEAMKMRVLENQKTICPGCSS